MRCGWLAAVGAAFALAAAPAQAGCTLGKVAELPVTMVGMAPVIDAKFNGQPVRLEADSGAFFSMISAASAEQNHLPREPAPMGLRVYGVNGAAEVDIARVQSFSIAGADIHDVEFLVGGTDVGVTGLLGRNLLGAFDAEYDLGAGVIRLFRPHGCGNADMAYWAAGRVDTIAPMEWSEGRTPQAVVRIKVNGADGRAVLDTGAGDSVLTLRAARRLGIDVNGPGVVSAGMSSGIGRRIARAWLAPVSRLQIGDETISNIKLRIADIELDDGDMLLGADFFLSHRVMIATTERKVFFTYQGGPVFDLAQRPQLAAANQALVAGAEPADAQGYGRRGAAFLARGDTDRALADLDKAVALAPKDPRYLVQRAQARLAAHRPVVAMGDVDAALTLDPANADARIVRARMRWQGEDEAGALADLDTAAKALPAEAPEHLQLGELYLGADRFDPAVEQLDLWVRYHSEDARLGAALNGRCWARALAGKELDRALADCNRAVGLYPNSAEVRDSRGLVRLRRGEYARAIADYDAALKMAPKTAWSLYGRGLAELKTGALDAGRTDMAAAEALQPKLATRARKLGIAPDEAAPALASPAATTTIAPASTARAPGL